MGSVLAASAPSPPAPGPGGQGLVSVPPGFTMPSVSPVSVPGSSSSGQQEAESPLPNPGGFEECHRKCKEVFPMQMEGVRLTVNKGLSNHFQINHTVLLSTLGDSSYRFGATYVGTKQTGPAEAFPVMVGDMDNTGSLNAQIIHQITDKVRSKFAFQTQQQKFVNWQGDAEFKGKDFTAAVTLGNPDVLMGSGIVVAHYLQSVTPSLALGGELVYHRRPGEEGTVMSLAGRYTGSNFIATLTLGGAGAHGSYYHKANDQLQVGVEFEASTRMQDTSVSFGYQLDVPKADLVFKEPNIIMKVLAVFVIAVFSGCHANIMWQNQPTTSMELVKNTFWNYVSQATLTAEDTLQMIRNSELGQEINDRISQSADAINKYTLVIQSQITPLTQDLLAKLSQEADQLKLRLEQEMTSVQSQLKPYVEEIRGEIEEQLERLKKDVAPYAEALNSEALRSTLVQGAEELKAKLERSLMEMGPQTEELKQKLNQHFLEFQMSMSPLAQTFQSQLAQRSQELQKNLAPYSEELSKLDPYAQDLKAQLTALWESFAKNKQS
ncbi:mitochondrial import receptor subunit TOM40-like protein [Labeo rohita]|uniref:Mitochondrial import receptor subunit TOM40-like protein n=1 Tax=Labeo rohita TaxID=84645 RepID=A0A498LAS6_LABRO|nr:mitochondrial import receptor subunit TOM40-like protein [Labeo rohita]